MNDRVATAAASPSEGSNAPPSVAIVGGGITGLAAALRLRELLPDVHVRLFESSSRLGGVLRTEHRNGYLLEHSADNFITDSTWGIDFCRRVGLADELIPTNPGNRRAGIVSRGRVEPLPDGFALLAPGKLGSLWSTTLLSTRGKLRLACEYFVPRRRDTEDESFAAFARRRLGREAYERIAQPLVSGIYTADPERLSMQAALARFVEMERRDGSLIRAARRTRQRPPTNSDVLPDVDGGLSDPETGPRYSLFVAPRAGMSQLIEAAAGSLPAGTIHLSANVRRLAPAVPQKSRIRWLIEASDARSPDEANTFDAVILAVPSAAAARIVHPFDDVLPEQLAAIEYAGCAIALVGCRNDQITRPFDGFGFVVPQIERRSILACSYSSAKFPGRAPSGHVLLRVFLGGACRPEVNELPDASLCEIVKRELRELIGFCGEPALFEIVRWSQAMPQYYVGHVDRIRRIEQSLDRWPTLALAGNAYHGVGIPQCIHSGQLAAERVASALASSLEY